MNGVWQFGQAVSASGTRVWQLAHGQVGSLEGAAGAGAATATGAAATGAAATGAALRGAGPSPSGSVGEMWNAGWSAITAAAIAGSGARSDAGAGVGAPGRWEKHRVHHSASAGIAAAHEGQRTVVTTGVSAGESRS